MMYIAPYTVMTMKTAMIYGAWSGLSMRVAMANAKENLTPGQRFWYIFNPWYIIADAFTAGLFSGAMNFARLGTTFPSKGMVSAYNAEKNLLIQTMGQVKNVAQETQRGKNFRDLMTPEEAKRYNQYWNNTANNLAKSSTQDLRKSILNGNITKTTGGKINSRVVGTGVDIHTGKIYQGVSGMKNNPTRSTINSKMQELLERVGSSQTNYPLDNCAEFNIINNALNDGINPSNLRLYIINMINGSYKAPCINCQNLYGDIVNFVN